MKLQRVLLPATSAAIGWLTGIYLGRGWLSRGETGSVHTGVSIEQVQALSSLVTARVDVADVTETRLDGHTGGMKAALLVKGDFLMGTDLSRAKFESINHNAHTAVLVLPQPHVASPRIDHDRTRLFALTESGLWQITPDGGQTSAVVINRAYRDAQHYIVEACNDPLIATRSRQQAEAVLRAFFEAMGWKLTVRWIAGP